MFFTTMNKVALTALFALQVDAFWRMPCQARSGLARIDPLVNFGSVSEHAHTIHGSSGFSETATYADLMAGDCTSCAVEEDKSAYWTPVLYFQDGSTGEFEVVGMSGGLLSYYLLNTDAKGTKVEAFPPGFAMIAGDTNQRNFTYPVPDVEKSFWTGEYAQQAFLRQAAIGFNCLNYEIAPEGTLYRHFMPDKAYLDANCADGIRMEIMFPSCWNGDPKTPKDRKSHVAYPSQVMTGECPPEFPKRLPGLLFETIWRTEDYVGRNGQFVLSNGDPTGFGYHGDFIMGWDEAILQKAVNECTNLSGKIEDCPVFTIQDSSISNNCAIKIPGVLEHEKVMKNLVALPGNPAIVAGPEYAKGIAPGGPGSNEKPDEKPKPVSSIIALPSAQPTLSYSEGTVIASTADYVPGAVFAETAPSSPPAAPSPDPAVVPIAPQVAAVVTAAPPVVEAPKDTKSYYSTEYKTKGNTVNEVLWVEEVVTVTVPGKEEVVTVTAGANKRHLHKHRGLGGF